VPNSLSSDASGEFDLTIGGPQVVHTLSDLDGPDSRTNYVLRLSAGPHDGIANKPAVTGGQRGSADKSGLRLAYNAVPTNSSNEISRYGGMT